MSGLAPSSTLTPSSSGSGVAFSSSDLLAAVTEQARVRVNVSATAGTLVSVTRTHPSGRVIPVRNMTLQPLNGGTFLGWDYEMPIGVQVAYTASLYDAADTSTPLDVSDPVTITWDTEIDWLKDPLEPIRNVPVLVNDMSEYDYATPTAVLEVLGRPDPVTVGEIRQAATGDLTLVTLSKEDRDRLHYITASGHVLLLQSSQTSGVGSMYLAPLGLKEQRIVPLREQSERIWTLTYQEVGVPAGDAAPFTTWQDVLNTYGTWADVVAQNNNWIGMIETLNSTTSAPILTWRGA